MEGFLMFFYSLFSCVKRNLLFTSYILFTFRKSLEKRFYCPYPLQKGSFSLLYLGILALSFSLVVAACSGESSRSSSSQSNAETEEETPLEETPPEEVPDGLLPSPQVVICTAGYVKNEEGVCRPDPLSNKYIDFKGNKKLCWPVPNSATLGGVTELIADAYSCPFTCKSGYMKDERKRVCRGPLPNKYVDTNGVERQCTTTIEAIPHSVSLGGLPEIVFDGAYCPFTCEKGYVREKSLRICRPPRSGYFTSRYVQDAERRCDHTGFVPNGILGGKAELVTKSQSCPFSCEAGYVANENNRTCTAPGQNKYMDTYGVEQDCSPVAGNVAVLGGTLAAGVVLTYSHECSFECEVGYVKDESDLKNRKCRAPDSNKYADTGGIEGVCNPVSGSVTLGGVAESVANGDSCSFTCEEGYVEDTTQRRCRAPGSGHYADGSGSEQSCNGVIGDIANSLTLGGQAVAVVNRDSCSFTCDTSYVRDEVHRACVSSCPVGYVKDVTMGKCRVPASGHYADNNNNKQVCAPIANSATLGGVAESVANRDSCSFTCEAGYVKRYQPQRACRTPGSGHYADGSGSEQSCNGVIGDIANSLTLGGQAVAVAHRDSCPFTCDTSYVRDEVNRACVSSCPTAM